MRSVYKGTFTVIIYLGAFLSWMPVTAQDDLKKISCIQGLQRDDGTLYSVAEAMELFGLKGLSVAVFENYQIAWTETWGIKDVTGNERIDEHTAFSGASIAKAVTASLMVLLEEKGFIDLRSPVADYLKRWQFPNSIYTQKVAVTMEHLLSHTAGSSQHGFRDFYEGDTIPTLAQSLNGEIPNDNPKLEFLFVPGTNWRYSGGGYVIAQMALEDALGESLAYLAQEYIFNPLGMNHTTMKQPHEQGFLINLAKAHDQNGNLIATGVPITPQVAPSGLWTTPGDMAIFMIDLQNALRDAETKVFTPATARRITDIVTTKVMGGWSLGWERRYGYGNLDWFSHGGANTGIGGHVYATMQGGKGIAMFGNGPNPSRMPVLEQLRNSIIKAHGWYVPLDTISKKTLSDEVIERVKGQYSHILFGEIVKGEYDNGELYLRDFVPGKSLSKLIHLGDNHFLVDEYPGTISFEQDPNDGLIYIVRNRKAPQQSPEYEYMYRKTE